MKDGNGLSLRCCGEACDGCDLADWLDMIPMGDVRWADGGWMVFCFFGFCLLSRLVDFVGVSACRHVPGFRNLAVDVT